MNSIRSPAPRLPGGLQPPGRQTVTLRVRRGDTLSQLAERFGVSTTELALQNRLKNPNRLQVGQYLVVSVPKGSTLTVLRGDSLSALAWRLKVPMASLARLNQLADVDALRTGQPLRFAHAEVMPPSLISNPSPRRADPVTAVTAPSRSQRRPSQWTPGQRLRLATAGVSTVENLLRLRASLLIRVGRLVGAAGASIALLRMVNDAGTFQNDLAEGGLSANTSESAAKLSRNAVRAARGLEQVVASAAPRLVAHLTPGLSVAAAGLDTAVALALEVNPAATSTEKHLAQAVAMASWVSALNIPVVSQVFGITATLLGLWRDAYGDERRAS